MNQHLTTLQALANQSAMIGCTDGASDKLRLIGVYNALMTGPLEQFRAEYIGLRDHIQDLRRVGQHLAAGDAQIMLDAIPMEAKWKDVARNLVTDLGANNMLDNHLSGSGYTAAWYLMLIGATGYTTGPAAGNTAAAHAGWVEAQGYSQATRPAAAWNVATARAKALSAGLVFTINANETIKGCALISNNTKGGATGTLFSAGLFSGGDQPVVNGNSLTVNYSLTL